MSTKVPHRTLFAVGALTALSIALAGCSSSGAANTSDEGLGELNIRLSWQKDIGAAGEYFADSKGYYTDAGFSSVNLIAGGQSAPPVASDVIQGNALYGIDGPDYAAQAIQAGTPLTIIGCQYQESPIAILSSADSGIASPKDLVGKRLGVQDANLPVVQSILQANDMDASAFTVVPWQGDATILAGGEVDAVLAFGVEYTLALDDIGFDYRRDLLSQFGLHNMTYCYEVAQSSLDTDRDALKAALTAEIRGWRDALADPQQSKDYALDAYGKDLGLDADSQIAVLCASADLMVTDETNANGLFTMSDEKIQQNMDTLALSGLGGVSADDLFDTTLLTEIYEENPDLKSPVQVGCDS
jgi:ABC-type nitrate/sulfonate/bicarbonate transport system substrate-binding protein